MVKIITSPGSYVQGNGELRKLAGYYREIGESGAYIIVDQFIYDHYLDTVTASFEAEKIPYQLGHFGGECCMKEINSHREKLGSCDVVVGIGGGKTLDTAKATAHYAKLPVIIVPTIASTDAPCSRLSVIYTEDGEFESYLPLPANPNMVLMDTEIISKAPVRFLAAGIGDALATYYEAAACVQADAVTMAGGHVTKAALALATLCRETLLADGVKAVAAVEKGLCTQAVENIIEANTYLSGVGFESGGLSAAHAVHNGLTVLPECHHMLHGEKVAFGTITQLVLENRSLEEVMMIIDFCRNIGLPVTLADLGLGEVSDEALMKAAEASCAENDTMGNMPFAVTPYDVFAAMKAADALARK